MNPLALLQNMSLGPSGGYKELLTEEQLKAARQHGMLGAGAAMMAGGGWSQQPRTLGQQLGAGLMGGMQMQGQAMNQMAGLTLAQQAQQAREGSNAGFSLSPGQIRYDAQGRPIAAAPPRPGDEWRAMTPEELASRGAPQGSFGQINTRTREAKISQPRGSLVTVNTGDEAPVPSNSIFSNDARYLREELNKSQEEAVGVRTALEATRNAKQMLDEGMITGFGADVRMNFARAADLLGLGGGDTKGKITATQSYVAETGQLVGQVIKQFGAGTGLSDADREYANKIAGGEISLNEESLRRIMDIRERAFIAAAQGYNQRLDAVGKHFSGVDDYYRRIDIDPPASGWRPIAPGVKIRVKP